MRPIDAEKLEKNLRDYADKKHYNGHIELANGILKAICYIGEMPTVDAGLVRHEKWIREDAFSSMIDVPWLCSGCNLRLMLSGIYTPYGCGYYYCPNCGAKMDRKEETP